MKRKPRWRAIGLHLVIFGAVLLVLPSPLDVIAAVLMLYGMSRVPPSIRRRVFTR